VLANWGGDSIKAMQIAYCAAVPRGQPEREASRWTPRDRPTARSRRWSRPRESVGICATGLFPSFARTGGRRDCWKKSTTASIDKNNTLPGFAGRWGCGQLQLRQCADLSSQGRSAAGRRRHGADFWKPEGFFRETARLRRHIDSTLEAALLADGVAPDKLYPMDIKRAFRQGAGRSRTM